MEILEVLIVVLVLLLIFSCMKQQSADKESKVEAAPRASPSQERAPVMMPRAPAPAAKAPETSEGNAERAERMSTYENIESFAVCGGMDNEASKQLDCVCGDSPDLTFAVHEFGAPGMDYAAFASTQEIDPEVIKNHATFVSERSGFTGRTFSPDSHDSYDPISWVGLRRPEYVKVCNPTQVPDIDINLYKSNRQFCFKT